MMSGLYALPRARGVAVQMRRHAHIPLANDDAMREQELFELCVQRELVADELE